MSKRTDRNAHDISRDKNWHKNTTTKHLLDVQLIDEVMQQLRHGVRDRCVAHGEERRQSLHHHLRVLPVAHLQQRLNQSNLLIRQRLDAKPAHA